jgi:hypothetical protein
MSSTYSTSLRIQLIDTFTEDEAWGQPTDNNLGTIIEQAITGVESVSLTNLTSLTLSTANAAVDQARNAVLVFTGTPTANCNVIAPSVNKVYIAKNSTSGGYNVNIKTSGGNAVVIPANASLLVYCNGTDFKSVTSGVIGGDAVVVGNMTLTGNLTANNITVTNTLRSNTANLTLTSNTSIIRANTNTGALMPPVGNIAQRPATPKNGMSRFNSEINAYEIYSINRWQSITSALQGLFLVVAGGGGGADAIDSGTVGGGGGAGGYLEVSYPLYPGAYSIVIGSGGSRGAPPTAGANSTVSIVGITAVGGGHGIYNNEAGGTGGSGGGGSKSTSNVGGAGAAGTSGQGFAGGSAFSTNASGGGGGSSQVGSNAIVSDIAGGGGNGTSSTITGTAVTYAGGGGGAGIGYLGLGGSGGGGNGAGYNGSAYDYSTAGTNGRGGGGGGGFGGAWVQGSNGGSGLVIVRYASSTQRATGGTVTSFTSGGATFWVHTFTSSSTLTVS